MSFGMRRVLFPALLAIPILFALAGCGEEEPEIEEPRFVVYDHIAFSFRGARHDVKSARSRDDAGRMARNVYQRIQRGEGWEALKKKYSNDRSRDDNPLGPYGLLNFDEVSIYPNMYPRDKWSPTIAGAVFRMEIGEARLVLYVDGDKGMYGHHILKRLR